METHKVLGHVSGGFRLDGKVGVGKVRVGVH